MVDGGRGGGGCSAGLNQTYESVTTGIFSTKLVSSHFYWTVHFSFMLVKNNISL